MAKRVPKNEFKAELIIDPLVQLFEYGNTEGKEGYFWYDNMSVQPDDCIDVLFVINDDKYDLYFFLTTVVAMIG